MEQYPETENKALDMALFLMDKTIFLSLIEIIT